MLTSGGLGIGAAVGGTFSLLDTSGRIVLNVVGGIAVGLAVGYVVRKVRKRLDDPPIEVALAVLSGYLAYLPAAAIGVSGVLAAVTIGVYMGWYTPELTNERTRLTGECLLHIPLASRHGATVDEGDTLYYLWFDFFFTLAGQEEYMSREHHMKGKTAGGKRRG